MKALHVREIVRGTNGKSSVLPSEATVECESEDGRGSGDGSPKCLVQRQFFEGWPC